MNNNSIIIKKIVFSVIVVIFIFIIFAVVNTESKVEITEADSIYELAFSVSMKNSERIVYLFYKDDYLYLFLPSGAKEYKAANLGAGDSVAISDDKLVFYNKSKNETQEMPIVVMKSENIASAFIDLGDIDRDKLDEQYKAKYSGSASFFDENGKLVINKNLSFIRNRGNSSYMYAQKKAYEIEFKDKYPVLGMDEAKKWVLLANYFDNSLMRNTLVYDFAEKYTDIISEEGEYVDLYINGEYLGNYYLCEKVEIADNRVDIRNQENVKNYDKEDITGGYLVELMSDYFIKEDTIYFTTNKGFNFEIKSPENPSSEQIEYIRNLFNELEEAATSTDGIAISTGRHYSEILDINSYVEKYMIETMFMNMDINNNSQYFYKNSDSIDSHIYVGPVWDYDMAIHYNEEPFIFNDFYLEEELFKFSDITELWINEYETVINPYIYRELECDLSGIAEKIEKSAEMNYSRWSGNIYRSSHGYASVSANAEFILNRLKERAYYFEKKYIKKEDYIVVDYIGRDYSSIINDNTIENILTKYPNYSQIFVGWKDSETDVIIDKNTRLYKNTLLEPTYVDLSYLFTHSVEDIINDEVNVSGIDSYDLERIVKKLAEMKDVSLKCESIGEKKKEDDICNSIEETDSHTVTFLTFDGHVDKKIYIGHAGTIENIPEGEWDNGIFSYWYRTDTGEQLRPDTPILEDVTYCGEWVRIDWLIENVMTVGELDIDDINIDELIRIIEYIREVQEGDDEEINQ